MEAITVRIATAHVTAEPVRLVCRGLGSCVGIALWDSVSRVGGMSHVLLPGEDYSVRRENPHKFADRSIEAMVPAMVALGAQQRRLIAKLAGGARMFATVEDDALKSVFRMGERNLASVKATLGRLGIPIVAEDTGGSWGRTMEFQTQAGRVVVTAFEQPTKEF